MKKKFLKCVGVLCIVTTFSIFNIKPIYAAENKSYEDCIDNIKHYKNRIEKNNDLKEPLGKIVTKDNINARLTYYTMADLNKLDYPSLVNFLTTIEWYQVSDIFQFNKDSLEFYKDENRVQALVDGIEKAGKVYTKDDDKGIETLVEVLRAGYYLGFYNDELKYLDKRETKDKALKAMIAIQSNANFKLGEQGQNTVIASLGRLIGNGSCNVEVVNNSAKIIEDFSKNLDEYSKDFYKGSAAFELMKGIEYDIYSYRYDEQLPAKDKPWYGKIDNYLNQVSKLVIVDKVNEDNSWVINNGIYFTSKMSGLYSKENVLRGIIEKALNFYPYLGEQYFTAAQRIMYDFDSKLIDGTELNVDKIKADGKAMYLPKTYTFDNGKMKIIAGDKVTEEKIRRLYFASKEVSSQFFRVVQNDVALENGNADDVLTMVIYNSPKEYKYNSFLNELSTDNGGIYIEGEGTFYTYERTEQESIFSLEELFRHEYTHYLQGRYLVPGQWGTGDFYKDNFYRLTWFEEGSAEFFAGATRLNNILPRKSVVGGLSDNPSERFDVNRLFDSQYGSWEFYNYGFAFSDYMYNNKKDLFFNINKNIKTNNVTGYEAYLGNLRKDTTINDGYQKHMQALVDSYDKLNVPLVSDEYIQKHTAKDVQEIKTEIVNNTKIKNPVISSEKGQFGTTFKLQGTFTGTVAKGEIEDWNAMNTKLNAMLTSISNLSWSGYKTVNGYFTNYKINQATNNYEFDLIFTGVVDTNEAVFLKGDINKDGKIDIVDLTTTSLRYNEATQKSPSVEFVDINKDGIVDIFDLTYISKNFN